MFLKTHSYRNWKKTTAVFTGKRQQHFTRTKIGFVPQSYFEYEITYTVDGKTLRGWYTFYPLPDPEPDEIKNSQAIIQYSEKKPYRFELLEWC